MQLNNKQREKLINLGLNYLINQFDINSLISKKVHVKTKKIRKPVVHKRRMSAKARKAISIRMKKMWAEKNRK